MEKVKMHFKGIKESSLSMFSTLRMVHRHMNQRPTGWLMKLTQKLNGIKNRIGHKGQHLRAKHPLRTRLSWLRVCDLLTDSVDVLTWVSMLTPSPLRPLTSPSVAFRLRPTQPPHQHNSWICVHRSRHMLHVVPALDRGDCTRKTASATSCSRCWTRHFWEPENCCPRLRVCPLHALLKYKGNISENTESRNKCALIFHWTVCVYENIQ